MMGSLHYISQKKLPRHAVLQCNSVGVHVVAVGGWYPDHLEGNPASHHSRNAGYEETPQEQDEAIVVPLSLEACEEETICG